MLDVTNTSTATKRKVCYVSGKKFNIQYTAFGLVCVCVKVVLFVYQCNSILEMFWSFSVGA